MTAALLLALSLAVCGNATPDRLPLCADVRDAEGGRCALLSLCGNSNPDPGEECDDGNTIDGDGCSSTCQIDGCNFVCTPAIPGTPDDNLITDGSFEDSNLAGAWTLDHSLFGGLICGDNCFGGPLASDLDGNIVSGNMVVVAGGSFASASTGFAEHEAIVLPPEAQTLIFNWGLGTVGTSCPDADDGMRLLIDGQPVWSSTDAGDCGPVNVYTVVSIDLATLGLNDGAQHTIRFEGTASVTPALDDIANIFLDQVRILVPPENPMPPIPSVCTAIICGDGLQIGDEQCDDGNVNDGDGCSAACDIEQPDFVCDDALPPADDSNAVADGSLESGRDAAWFSSGTAFDPLCSQALCGPNKAQSGAFYGWFGGSALPNGQVISQALTIPVTATTLDFSLEITECDNADDRLIAFVDSAAVFLKNCDAPQPVQTVTVDIAAFADGQVHELRLVGETASVNGGTSSFFVDDLEISDNLPFDGAPSVCTALPAACNTPELFDNGISAGWTVINLSPDVNDGWGNTGDGVCGLGNWPGGNVTGGGGGAACADSDSTGQYDIDFIGGGTPLPMDTYLCTPALDPSQVTDPLLSFLVNYQTKDNGLNDNQTPDDPSDDFDDDFLELLVGTTAPNVLTLPNFESLGQILDHLDTSLAYSPAQSVSVALTDVANESEVYACFHYTGTYDWFAQIDNVALRGSACLPDPKGDGDGVPDSIDNCTVFPNPTQLDTDGDGHGNRCDADFNNDCVVNAIDLGIFRTLFFGADNQGDLDGNGTVSVIDLGLFRSLFFSTPGPSANGLCD